MKKLTRVKLTGWTTAYRLNDQIIYITVKARSRPQAIRKLERAGFVIESAEGVKSTVAIPALYSYVLVGFVERWRTRDAKPSQRE